MTLRAGVGVSTLADARAAAEQAVSQALVGAGRADAALLLAGPGHGESHPRLLEAAMAGLGTRAVVGAAAHGVIGAGREYLGERAVAVLALSGLEALPFLLDEPGPFCGGEVAGRLGRDACPDDLVLLFPDARAIDADGLLAGLSRELAPAVLVGAGSVDPAADRSAQWCGNEIVSGGIAGLLLRGSRPPRIGVTQACRPVTPLLAVTRARGHWILELEGRPALEVFREVARGPLAEDLRRAAAFLLVALPSPPCDESLASGHYLVRHIVGFEPHENAFAIPEAPRIGQRLALAQREPAAAREDLKAMLDGLAGGSPAFGLYLDCCARGAPFFGFAGLEAGYLEQRFGALPIAGMFGSCEIGPIAATPQLLTYTGVLALMDG